MELVGFGRVHHLRGHIVRDPHEVTEIRTSGSARVFDAGGHVLGSLRIEPGVPASLPSSRRASWVRLQTAAGATVVPIPPRLR